MTIASNSPPRRGDEPGSTRTTSKVYGLASNGGGYADGQTQSNQANTQIAAGKAAVTPAGPTGKRASDKCQTVVGGYGGVFPATPAGTESAVDETNAQINLILDQ
jgi:hypothetical protein